MTIRSAETIRDLRRRGALTRKLADAWFQGDAAECGDQSELPLATWIQRTDLELERWASTFNASPIDRTWLIVHLQLVAMRKTSAETTLVREKWLIPTKHGHRLNHETLVSVHPENRGDGLSAAWLCCEISALFYRTMLPHEGQKALNYARKFVKLTDAHSALNASDVIDGCLLRALMAISAVRLDRRIHVAVREHGNGYAAEVDPVRELQAAAEALHHLDEHSSSSEYQGGIDLTLAMIRDLQAVLAWQAGRIDEARMLVHEAMALLSCGSTRDDIRLAVAQKTAATIEAAQSRTNLTAAVRWSLAARVTFRRYRHPFEWRALLQEAVCHIKADRHRAAELALEQLEHAVPRSVPDGDDVERWYARSEVAVARTWLHQRRVLGPQMSSGIMSTANLSARQDWLNAAAPFADWWGKVPIRVLAEGLLQLGLAKLGFASLVNEGRQHVLAARQAARSAGRAATEVACLLALAESYHRDSPPNELAITYWREAKHLLTSVESTFLKEWSDRLEPLFADTVLARLDQAWPVLEDQLLTAYLRFHLGRTASISDAIAATGIGRTRFYKLVRRLGLHSLPVRSAGTRSEEQEVAAPDAGFSLERTTDA